MCFLTSRTALIIPSRQYKKDYLLVSTTPGSTLKVKYTRYWGAIERMIEFAVETRTLAQLVERASYGVLNDLSYAVARARETLHSGDIDLDHIDLPKLVRSASNVRRLAAMIQSLSDPLVWSRSEYAIEKAKYLQEQLGFPALLAYIDNNISSINSMVDHIDELFALDLAEKENDLSVVLTIGLAAVSLLLTLVMLPSFWADLKQIQGDEAFVMAQVFKNKLILDVIGWGGTILGTIMFGISFFLIREALKKPGRLWNILQRSINRLGR